MSAAATLDLDALDAAALRAWIRSKDEQLCAHAAEIERLKLLIARLQRMQFGRKSEKLEREIRQLELQLGDLEESAAETTAIRAHVACGSRHDVRQGNTQARAATASRSLAQAN